MREIIELVEKIIEEHRTILQKMETLEQVANDVEAIAGLKTAKDSFMPGRFSQKKSLEEFRELLQTVDEGLQAHFSREEKTLLAGFEKYGDSKLAKALHSLFTEHKPLRDRLARSKEHMTQLSEGGLPRQIWEATAYDMRAYISETRKRLKTHAESEQELLRTLLNESAKEPDNDTGSR